MLEMQTKKLPKLDDMCNEIFKYFIARYMKRAEPIRFNELLRQLEENNLSISKPTLSLHLSHLVENGLVKRNEINPLNVSYRFFNENWEGIRESIEELEKTEAVFQQEKADFIKEPIPSKLSFILGVLILRILNQLKAELEMKLDPENAYTYQLKIMTYTHFWNRFIKWTMKSFENSDKKTQEKFIAEIEKMINEYQNALFET